MTRLTEVERGVDGVVEDDDVAALDGRGREQAVEAAGGPVCLSTRRKSPTRRVDSIDSEGMRKGWTQKVMMKMAMMMTEKRDWTAGRKPWVSWCAW